MQVGSDASREELDGVRSHLQVLDRRNKMLCLSCRAQHQFHAMLLALSVML